MSYCQSLYNDGYSFADTGSVNGINQYFYTGHTLMNTYIDSFSAKFKTNATPLTGNITVQIINSDGSLSETSTTVLDASTLTGTLQNKAFFFTGSAQITNGMSIRINGDGITAGRAEIQSNNGAEIDDMLAKYYPSNGTIDGDGANLTFCVNSEAPPAAGGTILPPPIAWVNI